MPDLTISTTQFIELAPVLADVETLRPPPTDRGRYVLGKAAGRAAPAFAKYVEEEQKLIRLCAVKDDKGNPILRDIGGGRIHFDIIPDLQEDYNRDIAALRAPDVVLSGVRMITHAELGQCPLTAKQERVLIECGLLEDVEPA